MKITEGEMVAVGSVAAALRLLAKAVLTQNLARILARLSERGISEEFFRCPSVGVPQARGPVRSWRLEAAKRLGWELAVGSLMQRLVSCAIGHSSLPTFLCGTSSATLPCSM